MQDHLHLLLIPKERSLAAILGEWKSYSTNLLHDMGVRGPVWQRSFYDHALRSEEGLMQAAEYVVNNPVRSGLAQESKRYPYAYVRWADNTQQGLSAS